MHFQELKELYRNNASGVHMLVFAAVAVFVTASLVQTVNLGSDNMLAAAALPTQANEKAKAAPREFIPGQVIVQFKPGVSHTVRDNDLRNQNASIKKSISGIDAHIINVPVGAEEKVVAALAHNPRVEYAELDGIVYPDITPNDPKFSGQWGSVLIHAPAGWDISTGSPSIIVAIIDDGVDSNHPDLKANMVNGWNAYSNNSMTYLSCGRHGTAVAGTANSIGNNATGTAGVSWNTKIMPVVLTDNNCTGSWDGMANGLIWAADHGARVANISWGGPGTSATLQNAINYAWNKGVVVVVSAGNTGDNVPQFPAAAQHVVAVAGTGPNNSYSSGSSYGSWIALSAPFTAYTTDVSGSGGYTAGEYINVSGTSFSSPFTAGLAALVLSVKPSLTNQQVVDLMKQNAEDLGPVGPDEHYGYGQINVAKTLIAASGATGFVDTIAPTASFTMSATVSGQQTITLSPKDNIEVTRVELYKDGSLYATDTIGPFTFYWDTTAETNGSTHTISYKAYDAAGNVGTSNTATVKVDNLPPAITITAPQNSASLSGSVNLAATVTDVGSSISSVCFIVDATNAYTYCSPSVASHLVATLSSGSYIAIWNSSSFTAGAHTIRAYAYDSAGNSVVASVNVTLTSGTTDTTPPTVSIASPSSGALIVGTTSVYVQASDTGGPISRVELWKDGALFNISTSTTDHTFSWNTLSETNGTHTLQAKAFDSAGNADSSATISVNIQNAVPDTLQPVTSILSPLNGATVSGTSVTVSASASDNIGVTRVELWADGVLMATDTAAPFGWNWNTTLESDGAHTLQTKAYDAKGNSGSSGVINVTVNNASVATSTPDTLPPTISITSPQNGTKVKGNGAVTIGVSASDNGGIASIAIKADGTTLQTCSSATTCTYSWSGKSISVGSHVISATATDKAGNTSNASVTISK